MTVVMRLGKLGFSETRTHPREIAMTLGQSRSLRVWRVRLLLAPRVVGSWARLLPCDERVDAGFLGLLSGSGAVAEWVRHADKQLLAPRPEGKALPQQRSSVESVPCLHHVNTPVLASGAGWQAGGSLERSPVDLNSINRPSDVGMTSSMISSSGAHVGWETVHTDES